MFVFFGFVEHFGLALEENSADSILPFMDVKTLSAGVVVTRRFDHEFRYLLLRAYRYWDFPKGQVESGEEPLTAARREVLEETNLQTLEFPWGDHFRETAPYGHGKVARYYVAESLSGDVVLPVNPDLGKPEHHEFSWVTYQEGRDRLGERVLAILDWAHDVVG